jgi:hypothetical protein
MALLRISAIGLLLTTLAFAQDGRSPVIVARYTLLGQKTLPSPGTRTTIYTPTENGLFRISAYLENLPDNRADVCPSFQWTDSGQSNSAITGCSYLPDVFIHAKGGTPITMTLDNHTANGIPHFNLLLFSNSWIFRSPSKRPIFSSTAVLRPQGVH